MSFVGLIVNPIDAKRSKPVGCCFAFGDTFLTANHVLDAAEERGLDDLHVIGLGVELVPIASVRRHPSADVAAFRVTDPPAVDPFDSVCRPVVGEDVQIQGFERGLRSVVHARVTGTAHHSAAMTARSRGSRPEHLKRELAGREYAYNATILNVSAAEAGHGYSGGPVCNAEGALVALYAFAWTNARVGGGPTLSSVVCNWIDGIDSTSKVGA